MSCTFTLGQISGIFFPLLNDIGNFRMLKINLYQ